MCSNRNILVISLVSLFVFCEASYANRGDAVGQLMVKLGKSFASGGSKANALKAKSIRSKFLTEVEALKGLALSSRGSRGEFSGHILKSARRMKLGVSFKEMIAEVIKKIEKDIQMARQAVGERRLYGDVGERSSRGYISRGDLDKKLEPMLTYLKRLKEQTTWPTTSIKKGYYLTPHNLTYHSLDSGEISLFPYSISRALDAADDAIILKNKGSASATEALIKVFDSKELLDVNSIHQMGIVVIKIFPNKIDGFFQDFVRVSFEKFAKTSYDFEVYRAVASLLKSFSSSYRDTEVAARALAKVSEDIMSLGHIVNGRKITEGLLDVIPPFSVVKDGGKLSIGYNDEWVKNIRIIDHLRSANTGSLSNFSVRFSNVFKRAREFGSQFVGDANLAKKVMFDFKDAILKGGAIKDKIVTTYFRWVLNDRKILSISNDEVGKIIAEIIESKNLFHLIDDPEISKILDEVPDIMESITKHL